MNRLVGGVGLVTVLSAGAIAVAGSSCDLRVIPIVREAYLPENYPFDLSAAGIDLTDAVNSQLLATLNNVDPQVESLRATAVADRLIDRALMIGSSMSTLTVTLNGSDPDVELARQWRAEFPYQIDIFTASGATSANQTVSFSAVLNMAGIKPETQQQYRQALRWFGGELTSGQGLGGQIVIGANLNNTPTGFALASNQQVSAFGTSEPATTFNFTFFPSSNAMRMLLHAATIFDPKIPGDAQFINLQPDYYYGYARPAGWAVAVISNANYTQQRPATAGEMSPFIHKFQNAALPVIFDQTS